jgi:hypothetical protein
MQLGSEQYFLCTWNGHWLILTFPAAVLMRYVPACHTIPEEKYTEIFQKNKFPEVNFM